MSATDASPCDNSRGAHVPLEVLGDTIQPFPSFSGIYDAAVMALRMEIADMPRPLTPMDPQMASLS